MSGALYSASDYAGALSGLMPRGPIWPKDPSSVQQATLGALAQTPERLDAAAQGVLVDAFPGTTVNLVGEWEESVGLLVADEGLSIAQRQAAVVAQLTLVGGQSQAEIIAYAASLGATIAITLYAPARCGRLTCGQPLGGPAWAFAWSIAIVTIPATLTPAQLLAAIEQIAPAETVLFLNGQVALLAENGTPLLAENGSYLFEG